MRLQIVYTSVKLMYIITEICTACVLYACHKSRQDYKYTNESQYVYKTFLNCKMNTHQKPSYLTKCKHTTEY